MAKAESSALFNLVHSLTGAEKRYYKIMSKQGKNEKSIGLLLFEVIEREALCDDAAIFNKLKWKVGNRKHFQVQKSLLMTSILKIMRQHHLSAGYTDVLLANEIFDIRFLIKKKIFHEAKLYIARSKKLAYTYERYFHLQALIRCENDILFSEQKLKGLSKKANLLQQEAQHVQKMITAYFEIQSIDLQVQEIILHRNFNRKSSLKNIRSFRLFLKSPAFSKEILENLFEARLFKFSLENIFEEYKQSEAGSPRWESFRKKNLQFLLEIKAEGKIHLMETYEDRYFGLFYQYLRYAGNTKLEWLKLALHEFKKVTFIKEQNILNQQITSFRVSLRLSLVQGDYDLFTSAIKEYMPFFNENIPIITADKIMTIYSYIAKLYLMFGDYSKAEDACKKIIAIYKKYPNVRTDLYELGLLLQLIIYSDTRNRGKLVRTVAKIEDVIKERKLHNSFEQAIISFAPRYILNHPAEEKHQLITDLVTELRSKVKMKSNRILNNTYFNFIFWYQSKIGKRSFIDLTRRANGIA